MAAANIYSQLEPSSNSIRLLRINKEGESESNDIICELVEVGLEDVPEYHAISYRWSQFRPGVMYTSPRLTVNGRDSSEFEVGENLYRALKQIRSPDLDVYVWADAICINQKDNRERGHQVKQMGEIYKSANEVLIWLGQSTQDIEHLFGLVTFIDHQAVRTSEGGQLAWPSLCRRVMNERPVEYQSDESNKRLIWALVDLLAREWWERVWILQEVAQARRATIMCGPVSCPARTFALMPSLLGLEVSPHAQAVLDIMPRFRTNTWWNSGRSLQTLVNKFKNSMAAMPRDLVYALLGMSKDACDPERFYPCYQISDCEVSRNTVSFLLFGEVLDSAFDLPEFKLEDIYHPKAYLTFRVFDHAFKRTLPSRMPSALLAKPSRRELKLILNRLSEGKLGSANWLVSFAGQYHPGAEEEIRKILSQGAVAISVSLCDHDTMPDKWYVDEEGQIITFYSEDSDPGGDIITITSKKNANWFVSFNVKYFGTPRDHSLSKFRWGSHMLKRFDGGKWPEHSVQMLLESGVTVEEILKGTAGLSMLSNIGVDEVVLLKKSFYPDWYSS